MCVCPDFLWCLWCGIFACLPSTIVSHNPLESTHNQAYITCTHVTNHLETVEQELPQGPNILVPARQLLAALFCMFVCCVNALVWRRVGRYVCCVHSFIHWGVCVDGGGGGGSAVVDSFVCRCGVAGGRVGGRWRVAGVAHTYSFSLHAHAHMRMHTYLFLLLPARPPCAPPPPASRRCPAMV